MKDYHIVEAVWSRNKHEIKNINNFYHTFGNKAAINAKDSMAAINEYILKNRSTLNHRISPKPITDEFMLVMSNYNDMDFFFFAYESHLSAGIYYKDIEIHLNKYYGPKPYVAPHRMVAFKPTNVDPATMRLMQAALPMHGSPTCPSCGKEGKFVKMALVCSVHGVYGGI